MQVEHESVSSVTASDSFSVDQVTWDCVCIDVKIKAAEINYNQINGANIFCAVKDVVHESTMTILMTSDN